MGILEDILESLPQGGRAVEEIRVGPFLTAVWVSGQRQCMGISVPSCGLASTIAHHTPGADHRIKEVGALQQKDAVQLARMVLSSLPIEACIGMAAVNALLEIPSACMEGSMVQEIIMDRAMGRKVAVIGHFPFVGGLREVAGQVNVLELRPTGEDLPWHMAEEVVPGSDLVVLTATVLLNGTYREILPLCEGPYVVMIGPSTPAASVLFEHGIDALAGSAVLDPSSVMLSVSQGATYRDLQGIRKWLWVRRKEGSDDPDYDTV